MMKVPVFKIGDRIKIPITGWTGTVTKIARTKHNGYWIEWDKDTRDQHEFCEDCWVTPINMQHNHCVYG